MRRRALVAITIAAVALAGCNKTGSTAVTASQPGTTTTTAPTTTTVATGAATTASIPATAAAPSKPTAAAAATVAVVTTARVVVVSPLPDRNVTPGVADPNVTQDNISSTICVAGYSATVRPPTEVTDAIKAQTMAAYGRPGVAADYELDHLISLELGGAPADIKNLWPEATEKSGRVSKGQGSETKDTLENRLHDAVCAGRITLAVAQQAEASDWVAAFKTGLGNPPVTTTVRPTTTIRSTTTAKPATTIATSPAAASTGSPASPPATTPATTETTAAAGNPNGATAMCNDGTYSFAAHHQGACSSHGGVAVFYK